MLLFHILQRKTQFKQAYIFNISENPSFQEPVAGEDNTSALRTVAIWVLLTTRT